MHYHFHQNVLLIFGFTTD